MGFGEAIRVCFGKYARFGGRARRSEYWYFFLFTFLAGLLAGFLDAIIGRLAGVHDFLLLSVISNLALLLPSLAVTVRRLHDTNRSGWLLLGWIGYDVIVVVAYNAMLRGVDVSVEPNNSIVIIAAVLLVLCALAYAIFLFVCMVLSGNEGPNFYGPDPRRPDVEGVFS